MRIWVDGQCFQTGSNVRGIGRYAAELVAAMSARDASVDLLIGLNAAMKEELIAARAYLARVAPRAKIVTWYGISPNGENFTGYNDERKADELILRAHLQDCAPDVVLSPSPFEGHGDRANPFLKRFDLDALTACIFHDAIPYRFPDVYLKDKPAADLYHRRLEAVGTFDLVLCNSVFTQSEFRDIFKASNAEVIGAGLATDFQARIARWRPRDDSPAAALQPYVLYVGGFDWRKNLPLLIRAMSFLPRALAGEFKLVLAGEGHPDVVRPLKELWENAGLPAEALVAPGWVSDEDLVDYYKNTSIVVQPSRMEGFGLGAIEAMACGAPFLAAWGGAVQEVVNDRDLVFDPDNARALSDKIARLLNDAPYRQSKVAASLARSAEFTWSRSADRALALLRDALSARSGAAQTAPSRRARGPATDRVPAAARSRLLLDVTSTAQSPILSGIQRVMKNVADGLRERAPARDLDVVLTYCRDPGEWLALSELEAGAISLDPTRRVGMEAGDRYLLLDSSWVFTDGQRPRLVDAMVMGQPVIQGVHDLGPLTMPAMTDEGMPPAFRRWFEFVLGHATGVLCVSKSTAEEVHKFVQAVRLPRPMKIGYFQLGADFTDTPADPANLDHRSDRPTALMVGTIEPRKGHYVALQAFHELWSRGVDVDLLLIGKAGWDTQHLQNVLRNHPEYGRRLHWRSGLSDGGLRAAYEAADLLIMASYLEGFGLPVVEAARFGAPVVLSDLPVFREVGESAARKYFFERGDARALRRCVEQCLDDEPDPATGPRKNWSDWGDAAERIIDVIEQNVWLYDYEPQEIRPNTRLSDVGAGPMTAALRHPEDRAHELAIVEGPFISDDGSHLRLVVSVKNLSETVWSSDKGAAGAGDIHLAYHLYSAAGRRLSQDNPRSSIPFVLPPQDEVLLAVRAPVRWLFRGATGIGVELVQDGVAWFGGELRTSLLSNFVRSAAEAPDGESVRAVPEDFSRFRAWIAHSSSALGAAGHRGYILSVYNGGADPVGLGAGSVLRGVRVRAFDREGGFVREADLAACFDQIGANACGYVCLTLLESDAAQAGFLEVILISEGGVRSILLDVETGRAAPEADRIALRAPPAAASSVAAPLLSASIDADAFDGDQASPSAGRAAQGSSPRPIADAYEQAFIDVETAIGRPVRDRHILADASHARIATDGFTLFMPPLSTTGLRFHSSHATEEARGLLIARRERPEIAVFGPYFPMTRGRYKVAFLGRGVDDVELGLNVDVFCNARDRVVAQRVLTFLSSDLEMRALEVEIDEELDGQGIEFRVFSANEDFLLSFVVVEGLGD